VERAFETNLGAVILLTDRLGFVRELLLIVLRQYVDIELAITAPLGYVYSTK